MGRISRSGPEPTTSSVPSDFYPLLHPAPPSDTKLVMKNSQYAFVFASCLLLTSAYAQLPESSDQPAKPDTTARDTQNSDYSKEAFVVERLYQSYVFQNDGTGKKTSLMRIHVLSESGVKTLGQLRFGYNAANDRLDINYVRVTKADGSVVTAGSDAVHDLTPFVITVAP